ncbi:MAG TPA: dethiobiotin synthase [Burkholderiales bacterium]|nr:dethiobiotin synthase [Burkholderiales bacterium]
MTRAGARGFFVAGTDTGVGKTLVACALLRAFSQRGCRSVGMKPVASGAARTAGELQNEDVERLIAAGNVQAPRALVNVYCFEPAIAPHLAARHAGVEIALAPIERAYRALADRADIVIVEGVGGLCVPLNDREDTADLATLLNLPIVLVVGMRLGCLNHALLTAAAMAARGLAFTGWVANHIDRDMACAEENVATLAQRLHAPCIARIPFERNPEPQRIARAFHIDELVGNA